MKRILFVEDNEKLAALVCSLLKGTGYEVEYFALGNRGLERFLENPQLWDAVMLDLDLPDISGKNLIPEFTKLRPSLPVVVYSGVKDLGDHIELFAAGASALVTKPCSAQDLLDILQGLIESPPEPIR